MKYTSDQQQALEDMYIWHQKPIKSLDDLLYTLLGSAGTGKTTVTKAFIESLKISKFKVAVTAPTHKAKKVIRDATGFPAETIQKLLGLRPNVNIDNFNINRPVFAPMAQDLIQRYKIILIDESSMINAAAFKLICKKAWEYKVRIIFIGDAFQLPPINEYMSKVFTAVKNKSTLNQIVRQSKTNPLTNILLKLRKDVQTKSSTGIDSMLQKQSDLVGDTGYSCLPSDVFSSELLNMYRSTEYKYNKNYIKFITYTNDNIEAWSVALRKHLLGAEVAAAPFVVGEVMTGYSTIVNYSTKTTLLENSADYIITKIEKAKSKDNIEGYKLTLIPSDEDPETFFGNVVFLVDPEKLSDFITIFKQKLNKAKKDRRYWTQYYAFKNAHLLLNNIYEYGDLLIEKDLYYGYGCTVHKSQGSTYDNVAINLKNIYINYKVEERSRLIYVALSRTRNLNLVLNPHNPINPE